jgi:hypothetical protein
MSVPVQTLHPDTYVVPAQTQPTVVGVGTNTVGFVGVTQMGPIDKAQPVSSFNQFVSKYGNYFSGSYLALGVRDFFDEGGAQCWIARVVGSGATDATNDLQCLDSIPSVATVTTGHTSPFNLSSGQQLMVQIASETLKTFTFSATRATKAGATGSFSSPLSGSFTVAFSGGNATIVTIVGATTVDGAVAQINNQIIGGAASNNAGQVDLTADVFGTASVVVTSSVDAAITTNLGISSGTSAYGTGDAANINAITAAEVVYKLTHGAGQLTGGTAVVSSGKVQIQTTATGVSATVQVTGATTASGLGFDNFIHTGADSSFVNSMTISAANPGAWGNLLSISTVSWSTTIAATHTLANGVTTLYASTIQDARVGDVIYVYNPAITSDRYIGIVGAIDTSARTLTLMSAVSGLSTPIPAGSPIMSSSVHKASTITGSVLANGGTSVTVLSNANINVGSRLIIVAHDVSQEIDVLVTSVNGNQVNFSAVTLGSPIPAGAYVVSEEFNVTVIKNNAIIDTIPNLSMEESNPVDYFGIRLSGQTNESQFISAVDLDADPNPGWLNLPLPVTGLVLAGGVDDLGTVNYIGSSAAPKSGLYLFDNVKDLNFFAIPGITDAGTQVAMNAYAQGRVFVKAILDAPLLADQPLDILNYRNFTLNLDSKWSALYYPWVVTDEPLVNNQRISIPPSGHMAGQWAAVGATSGVHVSPANIPLVNVLDVTYNVSDSEQDILNPVGINCIRNNPGEGIRCMGARTLTSVMDGHQYIAVCRLEDYIMASVKSGNRPFIFKPGDPRLFAQIQQANQTFLRNLWLRGQLYPSDNITQAFYVKCDSETTPLSELRQGRVICEIGFNPPYPAEFIIFQVGIWDGGAALISSTK